MTKKATVSQVDLGFIQIEGLLLSNGNYAVAIPQIADLFQTSLTPSDG